MTNSRILRVCISLLLPLILLLSVTAQSDDRLVIFFDETLEDDAVTGIFELHDRISPRITSNIAVAVRKYSPDGELQFSLGSNEDRLFPIASGFKGFLALKYLLDTPMDEWDADFGSNMYSMVVFSNNTKTSYVLDEVGLENFNDFLLDEIGMENGLGRWGYGVGHADERFQNYDERFATLASGRIIETDNLMTMNDLIIGYEYFIRAPQDPRWDTDPHFQAAIKKAKELMSIRAEEFPTPFESIIRVPFSYGKDGALRPDDGLDIFVINETIVLESPDNSSLMISLMTADVTHGTFRHIAERIFTWVPEIENTIASEIYQLDFSAYPEIAPDTLDVGQTYYGFVKPTKIDLYTEPSFAAPLENYFRGSYSMPTAYVFQGGLVRFEMLDNGWIRFIRNSPGYAAFTDMINTPHWGEVYLRVEDIHVIDFEHFEKIDPIYGGGNPKFFIIDKHTNTISVFEGDNIVVSSPVVLNKALTEEGLHTVNSNMTNLDMPYYPGVPFVMNFGLNENLGLQAVHGAPWQKANLTLKEGVAETRTTGGCVNLPNWVVPIGGHELPFDEFLFRWAGGMEDPRNTYEFRNRSQEELIRVIIVNGYEDLYLYDLAFRQMNTSAEHVFNTIAETPLTVPDSYYS